MSECAPIRAGFSAAVKRPLVWLAETSWRWAYSTAAWLLVIYGVLLFLHSLPVSDADIVGLSGIIPGHIGTTIIHILAGSGPKMLRLALALILGIMFLSWMAHSVGRSVVLRALLARDPSSNRAAIFRLNLLRTCCALIVIFAYVGCAFLIAHSSSAQDPKRPLSGGSDFSLLFAALACLVAWAWARVDGRLTLAGILTLRNGASVMQSILDATDITLRRVRQFAWIGFVFGLIRFVLMVGAFIFCFTVFGMFAQFSGWLSLFAVLLVLLAYSSLANFFSVSAMAAQVRVVEWDEEERSALRA